MTPTTAMGHRTLDIGFMPLIDSAPLIVASRLGLDRQHGLHLRLHRQASWAAIRDRLLSGELDAVHAMAALVYGVQTGVGGPRADLAILMGLNQNGQAITLSPLLAEAIAAGRPLADAVQAMPRKPVFAQTFPTGTHAVWLYYWLAAHGVDPRHAIDVVTLPPPQMPDALLRGELDGFCAGEPWGAQAEAIGAGRRVIRSGQLFPGHPEKVLACRRDVAALQPDVALALTTTVLDACRWLDDPAHHADVAAWLAEPGAIGLPAERIAACLQPRDGEQPGEGLRFHAGGDANFPWLSDGRGFLRQFRRWGWLPAAGHASDDDWLRDVHRLETYREAARALGVAIPAHDDRPSRLFDGEPWT